jgi:ferredoxin-NADP reductase/bacterioferritin-associated ferredoxin
MKILGFFVPFLLVPLWVSSSWSSGPVSKRPVCVDLLTPEPSTSASTKSLGFDLAQLQSEVAKKSGERSLYQPILSSDLKFLRDEAILAEGPPPQRNMRIVDPSEQFRFNSEAKSIFTQKKKLISKNSKKVIGVLPGQGKAVAKAVQEQFAMILEEFPKTRAEFFRREGDALTNLLTGDRLSLAELSKLDARSALERLGQFVPDDLIFMKKIGNEYRMIGGNLAFPTHWSIETFLGQSIPEIHAALVGTPKDVAAFSDMITKVMDRTMTSTQVVCRNNWFLETDPRYALPNYQSTSYPSPANITKKNYRKSVFLRTERQTLRGLPESDAVVFTIQPLVFPIASLVEDRHVAQKLIDGIAAKLPDDAFAVRVGKYLRQDLGPDTGRVDTKVLSLTRINEATYALSLEKPANLKLDPGEAVRVTLDTPKGKQTRTLSLANSPNARTLEFAVKSSDSDFKTAFKALVPGTPVNLELLRTSLEFKTDRPAVMIAGGIGITPFRSFIQHVKEKNLDTPMWLFYGNRDEIAFKVELDDAAKSNAKLQVSHVLSRPGPEWQGTKGRIDRDFLMSAVKELPSNAHYYIVAAPQMTDDVHIALREFGVPEERISTEAFVGYGGGGAEATGNPKIDAETAKDCQTVCFCQRVNAGKIRSAVADGARTLEAIQTKTKAATACGGCALNVLGILACEMKKLN